MRILITGSAGMLASALIPQVVSAGLLGRKDVDLQEAGSEYLAQDYFAVRPPSEQMRNHVLDLEGRNPMRPWQDAVGDDLLTFFPEQVRVADAAIRL